MLNKTISVSEQVADLSKDAQLFFTWSIPHADDFGLLPSSSRKLKGLIIPYWDSSARDVDGFARELISAGLWAKIEIFGDAWFCFPKWFEHQDLRRDVTPKLYASVKAKWEDYTLVEKTIRDNPLQNVTEPDGFVAEFKGREGNLREGKEGEWNGMEQSRIPSPSSIQSPPNTIPNTNSKIKGTSSQQAGAKRYSENSGLIRFEDFWEAYPKKSKAGEARRIWVQKKIDHKTASAILVFVEAAKKTDTWKKGMIPSAVKFLNEERWNDDLGTYADFPKGGTKSESPSREYKIFDAPSEVNPERAEERMNSCQSVRENLRARGLLKN